MQSTSTTRWTIGVAVTLAAIAFGGARAHAQMPDPDAERARQLVIRIRSSMKEIDTLLLSGAAPAKTEKELAANVKRLEDLLKETESKSDAVVQNIEELIKLAKSQQSQSSSGGSGNEKSPKPSSSDPNNLPQRQKSNDSQEMQKQQPQGQKPEDHKQDEPKDGDPKSGRAKPASPEQRQATQPPPLGPTGEFERKDTSGRWGMLPPKEAEDLQRRNADDFPQRYRRWMELYFQRVNRLPSRDH